MDPMQRWTLEASYRAFENGKCIPTSVSSMNRILTRFHSRSANKNFEEVTNSRIQCVDDRRLLENGVKRPRDGITHGNYRHFFINLAKPCQLVFRLAWSECSH